MSNYDLEIERKIIELRNKGNSYEDISIILAKQGIKTSRTTVRKVYLNSLDENKVLNIYENSPKKNISDEELYELVNREMSFLKISEMLTKRGISISPNTLKKRAKEIYAKKGLKLEKLFDRKVAKIKKRMSEIKRLRQKGLNFEEISDYYKGQGFDWSPRLIKDVIMEEISKRDERPEDKQFKDARFKGLPMSFIKKSREEGKSYAEISAALKKKGYDVSAMTIYRRVNGREGKNGTQNRFYQKEIDEDEIFELKNAGLASSRIAEYYRSKGFYITDVTMAKRASKIFKKRKIEMPRGSSKLTVEEVLRNNDSLAELDKRLNEKMKMKAKTEELLEEYEKLEKTNNRNTTKSDIDL